MPQLPSWSTLSDIGGVIAVLISVVALIVSRRGQVTQNLREKKEELRGVLENLITLREENNALMKEADEALKSTRSALMNIKRSFYLEAAEAIAKEIPQHVTGSEYYVIGYENGWDADLEGAQRYYEQAAQRSGSSSSPTKRSEILRSLASTYFINDPKLQNHSKGRAAFENAISTLVGRNGPYDHYARMFGYKAWAEAELGIQNRDEAWRLLSLAQVEWSNIPTWNAVGWIADYRQIGYDWMHLGGAFFQALPRTPETIARGRAAFAESAKLFNSLSEDYGVSNDYRIDALGLLRQTQAQQECLAGFTAEGQKFLMLSEQEFSRLHDDFPAKPFRLAELAKAKAMFASGQTPSAPPVQGPHSVPPFPPARDPVPPVSG